MGGFAAGLFLWDIATLSGCRALTCRSSSKCCSGFIIAGRAGPGLARGLALVGALGFLCKVYARGWVGLGISPCWVRRFSRLSRHFNIPSRTCVHGLNLHICHTGPQGMHYWEPQLIAWKSRRSCNHTKINSCISAVTISITMCWWDPALPCPYQGIWQIASSATIGSSTESEVDTSIAKCVTCSGYWRTLLHWC